MKGLRRGQGEKREGPGPSQVTFALKPPQERRERRRGDERGVATQAGELGRVLVQHDFAALARQEVAHLVEHLA